MGSFLQHVGFRVILALTAMLVLSGAALVTVLNQPAVYHAQVFVLFVGPKGEVETNPLRNPDTALIQIAGVVATALDQPTSAQPVSDDATIIGQGIVDGSSVRLPNDGGQWDISYRRPELDVQVAGRTADEVTRNMTALLARVDGELAHQQDLQSVPVSQRVTTKLSPPSIDVYRATGSRTRALAATVVVCAALTFVVVGSVRRRALVAAPAWAGAVRDGPRQREGSMG